MNRVCSTILVLCLGACSSSQTYSASENLLVTGLPNLPQDARNVAERLAACQHFSGEIGDNPPDRELEIQATMSDLKCKSIEQDVADMRAKYSANREVLAAFDSASQL